jgi:hypothetical protein
MSDIERDGELNRQTGEGPRSGIRRPWAVIAATAVAAAAAIAAVMMSQGHDGSVHYGAPVTAPADSWSALRGPVPAGSGAAAFTATGSPAGATPPAAGAPGTVSPFVVGFAQQPGVTPQPPVPSPTSVSPAETSLDGCDHHYGDNPQCVPWTFPAGVTSVADKCAWLAAHGFGPLAVHGADRQHLDTNLDGIACGAGD